MDQKSLKKLGNEDDNNKKVAIVAPLSPKNCQQEESTCTEDQAWHSQFTDLSLSKNNISNIHNCDDKVVQMQNLESNNNMNGECGENSETRPFSGKNSQDQSAWNDVGPSSKKISKLTNTEPIFAPLFNQNEQSLNVNFSENSFDGRNGPIIGPMLQDHNDDRNNDINTTFDQLMDNHIELDKTHSNSEENSSEKIQINLNDIHADYSEQQNFVLLFIYVHEAQETNWKFEPKFLNLTFKTYQDLLAKRPCKEYRNNSTENLPFFYELNLHFKHEILPEESNCKTQKKIIEIRLGKKNKETWGSLREICFASPDLIGTGPHQTQASSTNMITSTAMAPSFSPNTWTPCKVSAENNMALVKYENDDANKEFLTPKGPKFPGYTGLENLGNTCFINAVVQCLANTDPLKDYFISEKYLEDINPTNNLGMKGQMAKAFAYTLTHLWLGKQSFFTPIRLKSLMSEKSSQFSGSNQQDAQELMSSLLDTIHEDLNRKQNKLINGDNKDFNNDDDDDDGNDTLLDQDINNCPNVLATEINNRLKKIADKSWEQYRSSNNSKIIDLFCGQFKSILSCPDCSKKSIIFDPFLYVPLSIPPPKFSYQVIYFARDEASDMCESVSRFSLKVAQNFTANDLLDKIFQQNLIPNKNVRLIQPQPNDSDAALPVKFFNYNWVLSDHYQSQNTGDYSNFNNPQPLLLFELPDNVAEEYCELCIVQNELNDSHFISQTPVGYPFIVSIKKTRLTFSHLCSVLCSYARFSVVAYRPEMISDDSNESPSKRFNVNLFMPKKQIKISPTFDDDTQTNLPHLVYHQTTNLDQNDIIAPFLLFNLNFNSNEKGNEIIPPTTHLSDTESLFNDASSNIDSDDDSDNMQDMDPKKMNYDNDQIMDDLFSSYFLSMEWITLRNFKNFHFSVNLTSLNKNISFLKISSDDDDITLDDCFKTFTEPEVLCSQNCWHCPKCKKPREASKEMSFWRVPPILVIQLKRFKTNSHGINCEKINSLVKYQINDLDLKKYYSNFECIDDKGRNIEPIYDLYAVVNHHGSPFWGHYTAFARSSHGEFGWRLFDDCSVEKVDEDVIVTSKAYLLFYKRRDI